MVLTNSQPSVWSKGPQYHYIRYSPIPSLHYEAKAPSVIIYGTHQFPVFCMEPRPPVSLYTVLNNSQASVWSQGLQCHYIWYSLIPSLLYGAKAPSVIIYGTHQFPAFCNGAKVLSNGTHQFPIFCMEQRPPVSLYMILTNSQPSVWSQGPQCHYIWYSTMPSLLYGAKAPSVIIYGTHQFPAFCMEPRSPVSLYTVLTNSQPSVWSQGPQCHHIRYLPIPSLLYGAKAPSVIIYNLFLLSEVSTRQHTAPTTMSLK